MILIIHKEFTLIYDFSFDVRDLLLGPAISRWRHKITHIFIGFS